MPSILVPIMRSYRKDFERDAADLTDAQLLDRYARSRDPVAFELLLWRHGPMVQGVCRRVLADPADIDDAYQAVFVVLSRQIHALKPGVALAGWLHRVAWRTASNARRSAMRRKGHEEIAAKPEAIANDPAENAIRKETLQIIDSAIARLPACYREPFVLCELEGRPREAAAKELGIPLGTLDSRLARARLKLQSRLRLLALPSLLAGSATVLSNATPALSQTVSPAVLHLAAGFGAIAMKKTIIAATTAIVLLAGATYGTVMMGQESKEKPPAKVAEVKEAPAPPEKNYIDPEGAPLPAGALARIGSQRFRHGGEVLALAYSPDGKMLASASLDPNDSSVRVWNSETGKELLRVSLSNDQSIGSQYPAIGLGFSPDGKRLFIAEPKHIHTWDVVAKVELSKFNMPEDLNRVNKAGWLCSAAIAPNVETAVMVWEGGNLEVRSLASGKVLREIPNPEKFRKGCGTVISSDGNRFLLHSGSVYDLNTLRKVADVQTPSNEKIVEMRFLDQGKSVAVLFQGKDQFTKEIRRIDIETGKTLGNGKVDGTANCLEATADGHSLFVGNSQQQFVQILDAKTLAESGRLPAALTAKRLVASPDGKFLSGTMYTSGAVNVWDSRSRQLLKNSPDPSGFYNVRFSVDGQNLFLPWLPGHPTLDWRTGNVIRTLFTTPGDERFTGPTFSPDGRTRISKSDFDPKTPNSFGTLEVANAVSGKLLRKLEGHTDFVTCIAFSADGRRVATGGQDKTIFVWDVATGNRIVHLTPSYLSGHEELLLSGDGKKLFTCNNEIEMGGNVIAAWDVDAGKELLKFGAPTRFFSNLSLSPDGRLLAGGGGNPLNEEASENWTAAVNIWDADSGKVLHTLVGHERSNSRPGVCCEFSKDSRLLATGDDKGRLRLWETATGKEAYAFVGHTSMVTCHFSPDGKLLVAGSDDAPCYVWEVIPAKAKLDLETAWRDLIDDDAKKAFQAIRSLAANPADALAMLGIKLQRIDGGEWDGIAKSSPERLRQIRAVQALKYIGTPEALKIAERVK